MSRLYRKLPDAHQLGPRWNSLRHHPVKAWRTLFNPRWATLRLAIIILGLGRLTYWIISPVVAFVHPPPAPSALFVGINAGGAGAPGGDPGSFLKLELHASGCVNPVEVEGTLWRSQLTWRADKRAFSRSPHPRPSQITLALIGGSLNKARVELIGAQRQPTTSASAVDEPRLVRRKQAGEAVAVFPEWPRLRAPVHFVLSANILYPYGYHSCYVDVPELFAPNPRVLPSAYRRAMAFAQGTSLPSWLREHRESIPRPEIADAEVKILMNGHVTESNSIGAGGAPFESGVRYLCHSHTRTRLPPNLDPSVFVGGNAYEEYVNPNCSGAPRFEGVGASAVITTRLFLGGVIAALAATLLIEGFVVRRHRDARP